MNDQPTLSASTAAAAQVAAIRAYAYPEPAVEPPRAADHCACHRGPSLWDLYVINQMSCARSRSGSCAKTDGKSNAADSGYPLWLQTVIGGLLLVCAVGASVYDASKTLVLWAMVAKADALILPLGGNASVLFDRWERGELVFWWIHSLSICSTVPLLLATLIARVYLNAPESVYWLLVLPASTLGGALVAYHLLGYRAANRAVLDQVAGQLAAAAVDDDDDRKTR
ncbi:hypothetical protein psal_cds_33 [Pandoravirus salinus]|uniref:Uncharacterized protein n=1 Tax=Pandoravirus salinus TaxID=1349410 RepID=S4VVG4_9VIRU|nr:hypothetical protein psal_cds_33 [Pandoravirus salinus]AGO83406.1 hypothetical protein psal_cds_33 [Pandoravirus salinus]